MGTHQKKRFIGEQLRKAIDNKGTTISQLSNATKKSRTIIYKYLNNEKAPSDATLKEFSIFFNLPKEYFTNDLYITNDSIKGDFNNKEVGLMNDREKTDYARKSLDKNIQFIKYLFEKASTLDQYEISNREFESAQLALNPKVFLGSNLDKKVLEKSILKFKELGINVSYNHLFDTIDDYNLESNLDTRHINDYLSGLLVGAFIAAPKQNKLIYKKRIYLKSYPFEQVFSYYSYDFINSFNIFVSALDNNSISIAVSELIELREISDMMFKTSFKKENRKLNTSEYTYIERIKENLEKLDLELFISNGNTHSIDLYQILEDLKSFNLHELYFDFTHSIEYLEKINEKK